MRYLVAVCLIVSLSQRGAAQDKPPQKEQPPEFDGLKALKHPDPDVRFQAAQVLCDLGPIGKFAIPTLYERLKEEKSIIIKVKLAEALWKVEKPPVRTLMPTLLEALDSTNEIARANACNVIGQFGAAGKPGVPALIKAVKDKDLTVQIEAVLALGAIGPDSKAAVPALLATLRTDQIQLIEPFVVGTLGKIGPDAVPPLILALAGKEYRQRLGAAHALGLIGPPAAEAVMLLVKILDAAEPQLRGVAAQALGRIGPDAKKAAAALTKLLADPAPFPRIQAAVALWRLDQTEIGLKVLTAALKDDDVQVREQACRACGELGAAKAVPVAALCDCLTDMAPSVRIAAAETLGRTAATDALPPLRKALKDADGTVRVSAALALWRIEKKAKEVLPLLTGWLVGKNPPATRKAAAVALGEIGPEAQPAFEALLEAYREDDSLAVRRTTGEALKRIDAKGAKKAGVR